MFFYYDIILLVFSLYLLKKHIYNNIILLTSYISHTEYYFEDVNVLIIYIEYMKNKIFFHEIRDLKEAGILEQI